jgi:hypothetical protein
MKKRSLVLGVIIVLFLALPAFAAPIVLTFEGLGDQEPILNFYNGGLGGKGSGPGPNFGIVFGPDSLSIISELQGGTGNFTRNPSGKTIAFFLTGPGDVMNVAGGFDTGFSFFYSAISFPGVVTVWDGLNGTGNQLASLNLPTTPDDPNVPTNFDTWVPIGVTFSGTALSVNFSGTANQIGFDDVTLGSATPGPVVPVPPTVWLLGSGLLCLVSFRKKLLR